MTTNAAAKLPMNFDTPLQVSSRTDAVQSVLNGKADLASHDASINPYVLNAVERLLQKEKDGQLKLDFEIMGVPDQVLTQVRDQLDKLGVSHAIGSQLMAALEDYIVSTGSDFARAAQAKPLYARLAITAQKPHDMPNLELFQAGSINGRRKIGSEATQVVRQMTIYGSTTTSTKGITMPGLFESKQSELFYCFGVMSHETLQGITAQNTAALNATQALTGVASPAGLKEILQDIKADALSPQAVELIAQMAELKQSNVAEHQMPAKIAHVTDQIIATLREGVDNLSLPPVLIDAAIKLVETTQNQNIIAANMTADIIQSAPVANNDNATIETHAVKISQDLQAITQEVVRAALFAPTPEIADLSAKTQAMTPAQIQQIIAGTADAQVIADFKSISDTIAIIINSPQTQALISTEAKTALPAIEAVAAISATSQLSIRQDIATPENIAAAVASVDALKETLESAEFKTLPPQLQAKIETLTSLPPTMISKTLSGQADIKLTSNIQNLVKDIVKETSSVPTSAQLTKATHNIDAAIAKPIAALLAPMTDAPKPSVIVRASASIQQPTAASPSAAKPPTDTQAYSAPSSASTSSYAAKTSSPSSTASTDTAPKTTTPPSITSNNSTREQPASVSNSPTPSVAIKPHTPSNPQAQPNAQAPARQTTMNNIQQQAQKPAMPTQPQVINFKNLQLANVAPVTPALQKNTLSPVIPKTMPVATTASAVTKIDVKPNAPTAQPVVNIPTPHNPKPNNPNNPNNPSNPRGPSDLGGPSNPSSGAGAGCGGKTCGACGICFNEAAKKETSKIVADKVAELKKLAADKEASPQNNPPENPQPNNNSPSGSGCNGKTCGACGICFNDAATAKTTATIKDRTEQLRKRAAEMNSKNPEKNYT